MDVHPNPGWDRPICNSNIYNSVPSTEHHANLNVPANNVIRYSSCQLFSLKTKSTVPANLYNHLKECGVLKTRGVRSGKLVQQKSRNIPLLDRSRHFMSLQQCQGTCINSINRSRKNCHGVNFNNLTYVAPTTSRTNRTIPVDFCLLNTRSVKNKASTVKDFVVDKNIDLLALTESWLRPGNTDANVINELCPTGYHLLHIPRQSRTGGGVALLYRKVFRIKKQSTGTKSNFKSFEHINMLMQYSSTDLRVVIVYRTSQASLFFDEFASFLESLSITSTPLLITGDFNFHVDVNHDQNARRFLDLLDTFNLKQHISTPTHRSGHTLDLIITREDDKIASNFIVYDPVISDHLAVHCQLAFTKPPFEKKEIHYRKL